MMKFFRKYNKHLLAFFMVGLMIVFIGGSALQGMLTPKENRLIARSNVGDITFSDQEGARSKTHLLTNLNLSWQQPLGGNGKALTELDWLLLVREAASLGISANQAAAKTLLPVETVEARAAALRIRPTHLYGALAELRAVQQSGMLIGMSTVPSEAVVQSVTRDVMETTKVNAVVLPAKAFVNANQTFADTEMQPHFQAYRQKEAGTGLNFGYYLEPALNVQYFQIVRDKIAEGLNAEMLTKKAKAYYDEKRTSDPTFRRPPEQMTESPDAQGPPPDLYLSWDEAKETAIKNVRNQQADQIGEQIANWLINADAEGWLDAERKEDGYKVPPAKMQSPGHYEMLLKRLPSQFNYADAVRVWNSNFFTRKGASEVSLIGGAVYRPERGMPRTFGDMAFLTKSIVPKVPSKEEGGNTADFLAPFQTCPYVLKDRKRNEMFVFRVMEGREGRAPESLDEVRDRVAEDLRLLKGYETAKARAAHLLDCDPSQSLKQAFDNDAELASLREPADAKGGYYVSSAFSRIPPYSAAKGRPAFGVFAGSGIGTLPNSVVDACFALADADKKTTVAEMPDRADVLVLEWVETKHPEDEAFHTKRKEIMDQVAEQRWQDAVTSWFDPETIRARNGFEFVTR